KEGDLWEEAPTSLLSELETIYSRIKKYNFSSQNKREDVSFEDIYKIGTASVKRFKDMEGDVVITYQKENDNSKSIGIDEDLAFGLETIEEPKLKVSNDSKTLLETTPKIEAKETS